MRETHTYEAYLDGNTVRWIGKSPTPDEMSKPRRVTIEVPVDETESPVRGKIAIEALEKLAATGLITPEWIKEWEESRKDRPLYGREND